MPFTDAPFTAEEKKVLKARMSDLHKRVAYLENQLLADRIFYNTLLKLVIDMTSDKSKGNIIETIRNLISNPATAEQIQETISHSGIGIATEEVIEKFQSFHDEMLADSAPASKRRIV